jgi:hypothetical protein
MFRALRSLLTAWDWKGGSQEPERRGSAFCCALPAFRFVLTACIFLSDPAAAMLDSSRHGEAVK